MKFAERRARETRSSGRVEEPWCEGIGMRPDLRDAVFRRSNGRCEAEVWSDQLQTWTRCRRRATDVHHMITKGRGGRNLDHVGETYHLIHLCVDDHRSAHDDRANASLIINGYVEWDRLRNQPIYKGDDRYLFRNYGTATEDE